MAWILPSPQDMPQGDPGVILAAGPFKQEQERQIVRKNNDLTISTFLGKPIGNVFAVQVIERNLSTTLRQ